MEGIKSPACIFLPEYKQKFLCGIIFGIVRGGVEIITFVCLVAVGVICGCFEADFVIAFLINFKGVPCIEDIRASAAAQVL